MRIVELGKGQVKIEPCYVSNDDRRRAILFEPVDDPHEIGRLTGDPAGPHVAKESDTLLILGTVESAKVLLDFLTEQIQEMSSNAGGQTSSEAR